METSSEQDTGQKQNDPIEYVSLEFMWKNNPRYFKTELTHKEYAETMSRGMIDGKPISAVALWYQDDFCLVYNFEQAGMGNNPWKIEKT